jgi:hypothetical protein
MWPKHPAWVLPLCLLFAVIELAFLISNGVKFLDGAWLPVVLGRVVFNVLRTWGRGRELRPAEFRKEGKQFDTVRPGLMLALTLMVLLVASINYQLNLGYLLTFLLAGSAVTGMHVCHATLRGLAMNLIAPSAQYAGAAAVVDVKLSNTRRSVRHGIGVSVLGTQDGPHWAWTDVPAEGSSTVQVAFTPAGVSSKRYEPSTSFTSPSTRRQVAPVGASHVYSRT